MARPYSAGGVSIAESNHHAVGPLLLPLAASRHSAGLPSPNVPGAILIASDSNHTGFRPRRGGAEMFSLPSMGRFTFFAPGCSH